MWNSRGLSRDPMDGQSGRNGSQMLEWILEILL